MNRTHGETEGEIKAVESNYILGIISVGTSIVHVVEKRRCLYANNRSIILSTIGHVGSFEIHTQDQPPKCRPIAAQIVTGPVLCSSGSGIALIPLFSPSESPTDVVC
jgi:hypothetical protein